MSKTLVGQNMQDSHLRLPNHVWRQWSSCPIAGSIHLVELTREPRAERPNAWVVEAKRIAPGVVGDDSLYWRPWPEGREQAKGGEVVEKAPPTAQLDALGQPLKAGEVYVSGLGGALVPVSVEGVRWLIDCVIANRD